jgi:hypothetical protein
MGAGAVCALIATTAVGALLLAAGAAKLRDPRAVEPFLRGLGVGPRAALLARRVVPAAEVLCGAWLLSGVAVLGAAATATVLCCGFAGVLLAASTRGVAEPCRCFGVLDRSEAHGVALARALLVLGGAATALGASALGGGSGPAITSTIGTAWASRGVGVLLALCAVTGFALLGEVAAFRDGVRRTMDVQGQDLH